MLLRRPHELAALLRDGRARAGWSQKELAENVGVSRQWVSLVETGKTSVEFDLVVGALQALGYRVRVESESSEIPTKATEPPTDPMHPNVHRPSERTPLTREGKPLGGARAGRRRKEGGDA